MRWYNGRVPTPFYHLWIAEKLLAHPELHPAVRGLLWQQRGEFLLGNTAPDVQSVSGQDREVTHFFDLPIRLTAPRPWKHILDQHPSLAQPLGLPAAQRAFLAGYLCHLQADWLWVRDIFAPIFGPFRFWGTFGQRLYLHNVLRAYLDRGVVAELPVDTGIALEVVSPDGWLPFVQNRFICEWRDFLASQLQPGAAVQTVEVFAARQGVDPDRFYGLINSEARMDAEVFSRLPRPQLERYLQTLISDNLRLLQDYLQPPLIPATHWSSPFANVHHEGMP